MYHDWPCTVIWKQTFIIHTPSGILVLGFGSGHMLFLWWLSMYRHMKPNIHTPYSITHIGIGSWLVSYVVFMGTDHVPTYESIPRSSILNHAYYIYILGLGLGHMLFLWWLTICIYVYMYILYICTYVLYICTGIYHIYVYIPNTQYQIKKYHIKRSRFC